MNPNILHMLYQLFSLLHNCYSLADLTPQFNPPLSVGKSEVETTSDIASFRPFHNFLAADYVLPIQINQCIDCLILWISKVSDVLF